MALQEHSNGSAAAEFAAATEKAEKLKSRVKKISRVIDTDYLKLAKLLYRIDIKSLYLNLGYEKFGEFVSSELQLTPAKARALCTFWRRIRLIRVSRKAFTRIGFTKSNILARVVTQENVKTLLKAAGRMTVIEFTEYVKRIHDGASGDKKTKSLQVTFKFSLGTPEGRLIDEAISAARTYFETSDRDTLFSNICAQWLSDGNSLVDARPSPDDLCHVFNTMYPGTFMHIPPPEEERRDVGS